MDGSAWTSLASVGVAMIAAGSAYAAQRNAAKASMRNTDKISRTDLEQEAFTRAERFYTNTIDRQDGEIAELESKVTNLTTKVNGLERTVERQSLENRQLHRDLDTALAELETAKNALRIAYPDEH